jgi:glutamine amidotransferase/cyclase
MKIFTTVGYVLFSILFFLFHSGQGQGFDLELVKLISDAVGIPVIASSGAGSVEHFSDVFLKTDSSAALAAGIFHRKEVYFIFILKVILKILLRNFFQ